MIKGTNIHKRYGSVEVLKGVDMEVNKGEVVSIVGPSGSGKSTLLHILGTLDYPDAGHIEVSGRKIEFQQHPGLRPAPWWKRLLNVVIDLFFIAAVAYAVIQLILRMLPMDQALEFHALMTSFSWQAFAIHAAVSLVFYTLMEGLTGRTPGKYITRTKVIMERDGTKPGFLTSLARSAARLIPFEFASFFSNRPAGWHDSLAGTLVIDGSVPYQRRLPGSLTPKEMALFRNKHIGFVFQFHHLLPEFTALENVCIPGWLAGRKRAEVKTRAEELLRMLGLSHRIDNKPSEMSGGEQQRVAVARALINNPDIVFADEPTGNLDSANARELHQLFFDLRKNFNQTFLIVTHNEELAQLSDRVLHMKDGKIV